MTTTSPRPLPSSPAPHARLAGATAATALLGIGALHAAWGAGYSWPMGTRTELLDAVLGAPGSRDLERGASYMVAAALGTAAAIVGGRPQRLDRPRRTAVVGIAAVLASRGALGLAGHTHLVVPISTGQRFQRLDRRLYSPLCLTLAGLTALSLTDTRRSGSSLLATTARNCAPTKEKT